MNTKMIGMPVAGVETKTMDSFADANPTSSASGAAEIGGNPTESDAPAICVNRVSDRRFTPVDDGERGEIEALIKRIATGDHGAFSELYDRTSGVVYSVAHRFFGRTADAEDVTQEIFLAIWNNAGVFDRRLGSPTAWIVGLTRNKCIDRLRRLGRRSRVIDESLKFDEELPVANCVEEIESDHATLRSELSAALKSLPMDQRRLLDLAFFGGLTQQQIATELGLPLGTVKARIRRALFSLRAPLQQLQRETA